MQPPKMTFRSQIGPLIKSYESFMFFSKFQIGDDTGLMDSWKTLIVFFFQKLKFVSFLLFNSAVGIHNHRIRARRIRRPWRTFVLLPRTKPSGHWEVAIWFRLGCSTKLFFFKNLEIVKIHSIIKKPTISLWNWSKSLKFWWKTQKNATSKNDL